MDFEIHSLLSKRYANVTFAALEVARCHHGILLLQLVSEPDPVASDLRFSGRGLGFSAVHSGKSDSSPNRTSDTLERRGGVL